MRLGWQCERCDAWHSTADAAQKCERSHPVDFVKAQAPGKFKCAARAQGTPGGIDPADCDWPFCGCDEYANKVFDAIDESGLTIIPTAIG